MNVTIKINTDNAAFGDGVYDATIEVARILRELAGTVEGYQLNELNNTSVIDINGNRVGKISVTR